MVIYIFSIQYFNIAIKHTHTKKKQEKHTVVQFGDQHGLSRLAYMMDGALVKVNVRSFV